MKLIDADDVMEMLTNIELSCTVIPITEAKLRLRDIPTAYSVDKVVEELEADSSVKLYGSQNSDNYMIPVKRAIEIVKQGGVYDNVCEWKQTSTAVYRTSCGYKLEEYFETNACYCKQCGKKIKVVEQWRD